MIEKIFSLEKKNYTVLICRWHLFRQVNEIYSNKKFTKIKK